MLKLHGMSRSNYYCLAKACLVAKGIPFEEVDATPSQEEDYLSKSPMGKVPCLETDQGFVSETLAIAEYLDGIAPDRPLLPAEPFARAKTLELIRHLELDIELVARRCLPAAFFGATASEETKKSTDRDLKRGVRAVSRLFVCDPYATGSEFTLADLYTFYTPSCPRSGSSWEGWRSTTPSGRWKQPKGDQIRPGRLYRFHLHAVTRSGRCRRQAAGIQPGTGRHVQPRNWSACPASGSPGSLRPCNAT
jgi:glutathione S-transferase